MTKINFLGTADSIPSFYRNHSSLLITSGTENILVDCGEGTQRQFRYAKLNPCKITKILITHWHGDHVLGLPGLLSTLALSGYNKTLEIYGPKGIKKNLKNMFEVFPFHREYGLKIKEVSSGKFFEDDDFYLEAEEMEHNIPCLAYNFIEKGHIRVKPEKVEEIGPGEHMRRLKKGEDISINGKKFKSKDCIFKEGDIKISVVLDTKLNSRIVPFVKGADFFICEGTYSSELKKEAKEHMHLTVSQAGKIAKKANVKKLFIIHVSSRHSKNFKELISEVKKEFEEVYFVKDLDVFIL